MTDLHPIADFDEYVWPDLNVALDTREHIGEHVDLSELITYAEANEVDQGIRARLQKATEAVVFLMDDGMKAIWDFARAADRTDGLVARQRVSR